MVAAEEAESSAKEVASSDGSSGVICLDEGEQGPLQQGQEFVITLHKQNPQDTLGLDIRKGKQRDAILVAGVKEGGLIGRYNKMFPNRSVDKGDLIVAVNGCHGQKEIIRAIGQTDSLTISVVKQGERDFAVSLE